MRTSWWACLTLLGAVVSQTSGAALAPDVLYSWTWVSDPQWSPDGSKLAYVRTAVDRDRDSYRASIWIVEGAGTPRALTSISATETMPRWSFDGSHLAFLSDRNGLTELYVLPMRGGDVRQVTDLDGPVTSYAWARHGNEIAFSSAATGARRPGDAPKVSRFDPFVTEELRIRADGILGFRSPLVNQLWTVALQPGSSPRQVTRGLDDALEPAWSADDQQLYFVSTAVRGARASPEDSNLFSIDLGPQPTMKQLTRRFGPDRAPTLSPDGQWLAYIGSDIERVRKGYEAPELYVMRADGSDIRHLTGAFEEGVGEQLLADMPPPRGPVTSITWDPDSKSIFFRALERGQSHLYQIQLASGQISRRTAHGRGDLREFSISRRRDVAALFATPQEPGNLYQFKLVDARDASRWRNLTQTRSAADYEWGAYEDVTCRMDDGSSRQGWFLSPRGTAPPGGWPTLLYVHGGPAAMYGTGFFFEFQLLAQAGYAVLFVNPSLSLGYGANFAKAAAYEFPDGLDQELMACVDQASARFDIDPQRLGIAGGSAGGLITAYTIGQTTRFRAAIIERAVTEFRSWAGTNDLPDWYISRWFHDMTPWEYPENYLARSPLSYVGKVTTPVLVIHNDNDYRVPLEQGLQYYTALKLQKKVAKLAVFPHSTHGMSRDGRPSQRVTRLDLILDWLKQHMGPTP